MKLNKQANFRHFEFLLDLYAEDIRETFIIKRGIGTVVTRNANIITIFSEGATHTILFMNDKRVKWTLNGGAPKNLENLSSYSGSFICPM